MDELCTAASTSIRHFRCNAFGGFTLIEVLVTLAVLSVGLLGMAALQIQGLRATHAATLYTQAVTLATDVAERLRATQRHTLSEAERIAWLARLAVALPQGDGSVDADAGTTIVSVAWNDHDDPRHFSLALDP